MAMHDPTDPPRPNALELRLREALTMGARYPGIEHILVDSEREGDRGPRAGDGSDSALLSDASFADPGGLSDGELKERIAMLAEREHMVSYERRILHCRMDLLRAELVTRLRRRCESGG